MEKVEDLNVGMVLARDLAWQRKYQITHITEVDQEKTTEGSPPKWVKYAVCLRYLGEYYADGRSKPSVKKPEREVLSICYGRPRLNVTDVWGYRWDRKWGTGVKSTAVGTAALLNEEF
jgi:hypothetical protein